MFVCTDPPGCGCGFMRVERMRNLLNVDPGSPPIFPDQRQQISPEMNFICDGMITKWIIGTDYIMNRYLYPEFQIWRNVRDRVYTKIHNTSMIQFSPPPSDGTYVLDLFAPIPVRSGDILGILIPSEMSNRAIKEHAYLVAYERQKICGICLKRLRSRVMPRNMSEKANMLIIPTYRGQLSPLDICTVKRQRVPNDCQQHSALPKTMLTDASLARCGARTDSTTQLREAWPISAHAHWHSTQDSTQDMQYAPRVCTLVLFIMYCTTHYRNMFLFLL